MFTFVGRSRQYYWSLTIRLFCAISRTPVEGVLPLCRDAVDVYCSPSWLDLYVLRLGNSVHYTFIFTYFVYSFVKCLFLYWVPSNTNNFKILVSTCTPGESGPGSNGKEVVLHTPQEFRTLPHRQMKFCAIHKKPLLGETVGVF